MKGQVTIGPNALTAIFFASNEEAGRLTKAVVAYMGGSADAAADLPQHIKDECDEIIRVAKIHRECGRLGGRPKTKSKPKQNQIETKTKPNGNQIETKSDITRVPASEVQSKEELTPLEEKENYVLYKEEPPSTPPEQPSDPPAFALVAEPVAQPTQPAAKAPRSKPFRKPDVFEVAAYCKERGNNVDAQTFVDFYESKGWFVGRNPMKDWKAAVRTWERGPNRGAGYLVTPPARGDPTKFYNPAGASTDWSKLGQTYDSSPLTAPKPKPTPQTF